MEDFSSEALEARAWEGNRLRCKPAVNAILNSVLPNSSASHLKLVSARSVTALGEVCFQPKQKQCPYTRLSAADEVSLYTMNFPFKYEAQNIHSMQIISTQKVLS